MRRSREGGERWDGVLMGISIDLHWAIRDEDHSFDVSMTTKSQ